MQRFDGTSPWFWFPSKSYEAVRCWKLQWFAPSLRRQAGLACSLPAAVPVQFTSQVRGHRIQRFSPKEIDQVVVLRVNKALSLFTDLTADTTPDHDVLAEATFSSFSSAGTVLDFTTVSGGDAGQSYYGWTLQIEQDQNQIEASVTDQAEGGDSWSACEETTQSIVDGVEGGDDHSGSSVVAATLFEGSVAGDTVSFDVLLLGTITEGEAAGETWAEAAELSL